MATAASSAGSLPDWDADSPVLQDNLAAIDRAIHAAAIALEVPTFEDARDWHVAMMAGLHPGPDPVVVGGFRGEPGLEDYGVVVGKFVNGLPIGPVLRGTAPWLVGRELQAFEDQLQAKLDSLDTLYPTMATLDDAGRGHVIEVAAWAHSEWVRIHPFANGNGRTARMWANLILLRYGMPPVMRLRPRPSGPDKTEYAEAGKAGMLGNDFPARAYIRRKVDEELKATRIAAKKSASAKATALKRKSAPTSSKRSI